MTYSNLNKILIVTKGSRQLYEETLKKNTTENRPGESSRIIR